ncbi:WD40 repeat domain-containing serine/threonine-protein kinase [Nonomuraea sp. NPDC049625]|uniref:WD40 repeat domain-containing serine/threonine protein kinase n=1 Tax=Nonomuraea sp. NPDC049625 TaxID=3155775 RepID=UPI003412EFA4
MVPLTSSDPHRLGRYWLVGRLGAGGQGVVYEAYGESGERVAIKVPRSEGAQARARLAKEASAAQRVASFCTAKVIEAQVEVAPLYIVSEYVAGLSLRQVVAESGPYEGDRLRRLAVGVATALTAIHQAGIVHHDLKPDNIILGPDGPRVIDFGVAREVGPTTSGPVMGTPNYMSPEVFDGRAVTEAADLWAWGLVVLFAARGAEAIEPGDPMAVIGRLLDFTPDVAGLPEPLGSLVAAALSRNAADRPAAKQVLLRLLDDTDAADTVAAGAAEEDPLARGGTLAGTLKGRAEPDLGAIAEELYAELTETERASVPEVFLRMIDGDALRPVGRDELPETAAVDALLDVFAAAGIVTRAGTAYALAMPGLLRAWPRLGEWVAGNSAGLPVHRRLAAAAAEWDGHGRKPADLLQGTHLDRTLQWAATERKDLTLTRRERDFLDAAARQARRRSRTRNLIAAVLAVLLVAALGGLGAAEYLRRQSDRQRDEALAKELALRADGLREQEPRLARLLSVAAWRLAPALTETRGALYESASRHTSDVFVAPGVSAQTTQALSPDGRMLASADGGTARIWDVTSGRRLHEFSGLPQSPNALAVSPGARTLAVLDDQGVRLWDSATGRPLEDRFGAEAGNAGAFGKLEFDRTGRLLSVPHGDEGERWWDVAGHKWLTSPRGAVLNGVSADGRYGFVARGRDAAEVWDLRRGRLLKVDRPPASGTVSEAKFTSDGSGLALVQDVPGRDQPMVHVYDLTSGTTKFAEDGKAGQEVDFVFGDEFVAQWDAQDSELVLTRWSDWSTVLKLPLPGSMQVRFDLAAKAVRGLDSEGTVFTIDVSMLFDPSLGAEADNLQPSPDGRVVAAKRDYDLTLLDAASGRRLAGPITWKGWGEAMAFTSDGRRLAYGDGARVRVLDVATGRTVDDFAAVTKGTEQISELAFTRDGRTLAFLTKSSSGDEWLEVRDLARRVSTSTGQTGFPPMSAGADGRVLVAGNGPLLYDTVNKAALPIAKEAQRLSVAAAASPDGSQVVFAGFNRLTLWDRDLKTRLAVFPAALDGAEAVPVAAVAWSPDARTIAVYEDGPRIRLWDVAGKRELGVVFDGLTESVGNNSWLGFSPDGTKIYSLTSDGTLRTHELDERRLVTQVCARAGRALSAEEWRTYLAGIEPFTVCPAT